MFSTDRISADLRMEEYKKIADSYTYLSEKKKEDRSGKSIFARIFGRKTA
ncbi:MULTISPECIES: hypothetical protein [Salinicoccus]|jgi:hypothetical protein|nr:MULTISPECIES: hypothetical protein [Salinicoccus]MCC4723232.1 hypothetical protein [Salinicoccus sp. RF5]RPE51951.1 hypothetical protein EDC33_2172 [Salinicoccus roseus]GGA74743.1 hypothetical protein GCM10007176_18740 [Salinicoccus roseus]